MNDKLKIYKNRFCGISNYWNSLVNVLDKEETEKWQSISENISDADSFNALCAYALWDKLFYEDRIKYSFVDKNFYGENNAVRKHRMIRSIQNLWKENELFRNIIDEIVSHWPVLQDQIFEQEKHALIKCRNVGDYQEFIKTYPKTYGEFVLFAELKIAEHEHKSFRQFGDLKRRYPNSTLIGEISERIKIIKLKDGREIQCMYSKEVNSSKKLQDALEKFMESFVGPFNEEDNKTSQHGFYVLPEPITVSCWRTIVEECRIQDLDIKNITFSKDDSTYVVASYDTFEKMTVKLGYLLSLGFFIPTLFQLQCLSYDASVLCQKGWEWFRLNDANSGQAGVIGEFEDQLPKVYKIPKNKYGVCRMVFFQ